MLLAALAVIALSCARGPRVIPVRKMEKIYREMFLADQWLADNPAKRVIADTSWFYEPIFEKYGFNVEDYRKSVDFYLSDPKRYAEMLGRVAEGLQAEAEAVNRKVAQKEKMRHKADSIANLIKNIAPENLPYYGDLFYVNSMTDKIDIRLNERGTWFPVPVVEDTVYHGPELIIRDTAVVEDPADSLQVEEIVPIVSLDKKPVRKSKTLGGKKTLELPTKEELVF